MRSVGHTFSACLSNAGEASELKPTQREMVVRGGASLVQREPVFSKDGKRLLVCTACAVTVFSVQTGEVLTVLKGHTEFVGSVVVVPAASVCLCWTAGLDGTVRFWDFKAGVLLRTVEVGHPVHSMVIPQLCKPRKGEKGEGTRKALVAFLSVGWVKEVSDAPLTCVLFLKVFFRVIVGVLERNEAEFCIVEIEVNFVTVFGICAPGEEGRGRGRGY